MSGGLVAFYSPGNYPLIDRTKKGTNSLLSDMPNAGRGRGVDSVGWLGLCVAFW